MPPRSKAPHGPPGGRPQPGRAVRGGGEDEEPLGELQHLGADQRPLVSPPAVQERRGRLTHWLKGELLFY